MPKLFIICGHGAGDSGAVGNGYQEQERVRVLGKKIKELGGDNVLLGDVNRNFYADKGIDKLTISKDYQIAELHMDSSNSPSPKGAHVIIFGGFEPDEYDVALSEFFSELFPGRSVKISKRSDLRNPYLAAKKGYGYRLIECGFISNSDDVSKFNSNINNMAENILKSFGLPVGGSSSKPAGKPIESDGKKTNDQIAEEVLAGKWGNGEERRTKLTNAGYDYGAVQAIVNMKAGVSTPKMSARQFALEVWNEGKHGTGNTRKEAARRLGVDYNEAQRLINDLASGKSI